MKVTALVAGIILFFLGFGFLSWNSPKLKVWDRILAFLVSFAAGALLVKYAGWEAGNRIGVYDTNDLVQRDRFFDSINVPAEDRHHWHAVMDSGLPSTIKIGSKPSQP